MCSCSLVFVINHNIEPQPIESYRKAILKVRKSKDKTDTTRLMRENFAAMKLYPESFHEYIIQVRFLIYPSYLPIKYYRRIIQVCYCRTRMIPREPLNSNSDCGVFLSFRICFLSSSSFWYRTWIWYSLLVKSQKTSIQGSQGGCIYFKKWKGQRMPDHNLYFFSFIKQNNVSHFCVYLYLRGVWVSLVVCNDKKCCKIFVLFLSNHDLIFTNSNIFSNL